MHGHIHNFADFLRVGFRYGTAKHGKVLAKHIDQAAIDGAPSRDHPIAAWLAFGHPKIGAAMGDEHIIFFEGAFIEQQFDPFACGQLAFAVLGINALLPAPQTRLRAAILKLLQNILHQAILLRAASWGGLTIPLTLRNLMWSGESSLAYLQITSLCF